MLRTNLYSIKILFRKHVQTRRCAYTRKKCTSFLTRARGARPFARACVRIALVITERWTTVNALFEILRTSLYGIAILFGKHVQARRCAHARKKYTSFLTRSRGAEPFARACLIVALIKTDRATTVNALFEIISASLYGIAILFGNQVPTLICAHARKKCTHLQFFVAHVHACAFARAS